MTETGLMRKTDLSPLCDEPINLCLYEAVRASALDTIIGVRLKSGMHNLLYAEFSLGMDLLMDGEETIIEAMRAIAEPESDSADRLVKTWEYEPDDVVEARPVIQQWLGKIEAGEIEVEEWEHADSPMHPDNW